MSEKIILDAWSKVRSKLTSTIYGYGRNKGAWPAFGPRLIKVLPDLEMRLAVDSEFVEGKDEVETINFTVNELHGPKWQKDRYQIFGEYGGVRLQVAGPQVENT